MLCSLIFELAPADADSGTFTGRHVHGWFFNTLRRLDSAAADAVHALGQRKPFTLWAGPRFALGLDGVSRDEADDWLWLRITALDERACALLARVMSAPPDVFVLGGCRFVPRRVMVRPEEHLWCGTSTFEELYARWQDAEVSGRVRLRFLSPTAFAGREGNGTTTTKPKNRSTLFPQPDLVFGSLAKRWAQHAREPLLLALCDAIRATVREESYELRTTMPIDFDTHRQKGFVGLCEYSVGARAASDVRRMLHCLADFAFYSGVGTKTTMGMGQVICEQHVLRGP